MTDCDFLVIVLLCITQMADVVLLSRSTRPCESMYGHAWTFSEQVIAGIIDDSRCGTSFALPPQLVGFLVSALLPKSFRPSDPDTMPINRWNCVVGGQEIEVVKSQYSDAPISENSPCRFKISGPTRLAMVFWKRPLNVFNVVAKENRFWTLTL